LTDKMQYIIIPIIETEFHLKVFMSFDIRFN